MNQGHQIFHLIYEYFYLRIRLGYYQCGDSLPPIDTICREFNVGSETVKVALRRLRDEGYIDLGRGRLTRVLLRQSEQEVQTFISGHFSRRWAAVKDLYASAGLIFAPLLTEGFRRMSGEELDALSQLRQWAGEEMLLQFYCAVLQRLDNALAMNFFWETLLFTTFPLARLEDRPVQNCAKDDRDRIRTLASIAGEKRWSLLHDTLLQYRQTDIDRITAYLEPKIRPLPTENQDPFVWRIYRDRPQICYRLAANLLHDIYMGEYRSISYLPSYAAMAERYGVSVNTVRRAVGMLNSLGAAKSINGRGTLIYTLGKRCHLPDFSDPMIHRGLSLLLQAHELVLITCESVMRSFLTDLSPEQRDALLHRLEQNLRRGHCDISFWNILLAIATFSRLQVVREFYLTLYGLFLWGYPLKASNTGPMDCEMEAFTEAIIRSLREGDTERCVAIFRDLMAKIYPPTEQYLLMNGIEPKKYTNSIRFLAVESSIEHN